MRPVLKKRIFEMFMESQFWPAEQILAFQRNQLSQLLTHARANVPFYKDRLEPVFRPNGDIDWNHWYEIPIVKRRHLVEHRDTMLAGHLPPGHGPTREIYSSGSSGTPVMTTHNNLAGWVSEVAVHRAQCWHSMDWSKNMVSLRSNNPETMRWPDGLHQSSWAPIWESEQAQGHSFALDRSTPHEKALEFVLRKKAHYLFGRPQSLQAFALAAESLKIAISIDAVTTFGTGMTDDGREDIRRVLGARVMSFYSSEEGYKMAISCKTGPHYHINSELTFMEILDEDDKPCDIGQPGRVIITPLFNTAQPLIRYEQGDIATRGANCSCGKALPVLQEVSGRMDQLFQFPPGLKIAPALPDREFNLGFGSKTWQLAQTGPLAVELRYVPTDPNSLPNKNFAEDMIRKKIHPDLQITFVQLLEPPLTAAGKLIQYKSELPKLE